MRIVITGALGHIGSRLLRSLPTLYPGCHLVLIDNLLTQRYSSLFNLPAGATYEFIEADVTESDVSPHLKQAAVVIHLAAITTAAASFGNKEHVEQHNLRATQRVAEACIKENIPLWFPSTASVYGTKKDTVAENCSPEDIVPQSPYAATKLKEEALLHDFQNRGLRYVACRFGTIFGTSPGMRFHTAVNKFCWQAVWQQPLTVWRTALHQKRPYLDLSDAILAIHHCIGRDLFPGEIYNVVTINTTVNDIITQIQQHIPSTTVTLTEAAIMNDLSYDVLNEKFGATGFASSGDLPRGIADTIEMLRATTIAA